MREGNGRFSLCQWCARQDELPRQGKKWHVCSSLGLVMMLFRKEHPRRGDAQQAELCPRFEAPQDHQGAEGRQLPGAVHPGRMSAASQEQRSDCTLYLERGQSWSIAEGYRCPDATGSITCSQTVPRMCVPISPSLPSRKQLAGSRKIVTLCVWVGCAVKKPIIMDHDGSE